MPEPEQARTEFVKPKILTRGTITEILIEQNPFHCIVKITPKSPTLIPVEGRYSSNQLSLGKLKRNLVHLKFKIDSLDDIIPALESLEGRLCDFRIDASGWLEWISDLFPIKPGVVESESVPPPPIKIVEDPQEIFFVRTEGYKSIYYMEDRFSKILGYAVGPTDTRTNKPHGWVLNLKTLDQAKEVLSRRRR